MWRAHDFARFRRRSSADRWLLVEATWWLALARAAILLVPFRWTTRLFSLRPGEECVPASESSHELARHVGWALKTAAARTPWQSACLAQALAGAAMLRRRRIAATMAMGVAKASSPQTRGLEAHAWLSSAGFILTGASGHERYRVVVKFTLALHLSRNEQDER